ncbi:interferon-induced protein with tetratricopeptide repeats 5 [Alligator mississippiensis]|uniref:Interferon-induced protein with tetratricopeptide repeats 5 n=1 Tax=Alligator mississippiensis TaxID=8496 RepID=A0A151N0Y9_ALLMI|nr:interferon-induced protein with tetratricopeptide repeats 5 [Alligator mississippiensis]
MQCQGQSQALAAQLSLDQDMGDRDGLRDRLQALQCHFTWDLDAPGQLEPEHILLRLAVEIQHTPHHNQATLLALRAFLCQRLGHYPDALQSLRDAEEQLRQDFPDRSPGRALLIYGNYAWVHYHMRSLHEATRYLDRTQAALLAPLSTALTAEISAQKGWSLLAVGFRHGERARQCFKEALVQDPGSKELRAGLALALYAAWTHCPNPELKMEATRQMEEVVQQQPENRRAKVHLARLVQDQDQQRAEALIAEAVESSSDPEVIRLASFYFLKKNAERSTEMLKEAISLDPDYHLLYHALARSYREQWKTAEGQRKEELLQAAIKALKKEVALYSGGVLSRLLLAELYGEKDPWREEQMYLKLEQEAPGFSLQCRQALCLYFGRFLIYKRRDLKEAAKKLQAGYAIPIETQERRECRWRLEVIVHKLQQFNQHEKAVAITHFLQEADAFATGNALHPSSFRLSRPPATFSVVCWTLSNPSISSLNRCVRDQAQSSPVWSRWESCLGTCQRHSQ